MVAVVRCSVDDVGITQVVGVIAILVFISISVDVGVVGVVSYSARVGVVTIGGNCVVAVVALIHYDSVVGVVVCVIGVHVCVHDVVVIIYVVIATCDC